MSDHINGGSASDAPRNGKALLANTETDRLVAEWVMEWMWVRNREGHEGWAVNLVGAEYERVKRGEPWDGEIVEVMTPQFTRSIEASWQVVDEMANRACGFYLITDTWNGRVSATFTHASHPRCKWTAAAGDNEEPLAICLAALKSAMRA